jgi:hypothetical protein
MSVEHSPNPQLTLPGARLSRARGSNVGDEPGRIHHALILRAVQSLEDGTLDIVRLYREQVVPGHTRTVHLLGRKCRPTMSETLLGYELHAEYKRIHCPDRVTAEYLLIFTGVGCRTIKVPYDPTVTRAILPSLQRFMELLGKEVQRHFPGNRPMQLNTMRRICTHLRRQLRSS